MKKIILILTGFVLSCSALSAAPVKISKDAPIQFFLVERTKQGDTDQINFTPQTEKAILAALANGGFNVQSDEDAPLVSKTTLKYTEARSESQLGAEFSGYVHLRTGADGSMNFKTDKGEKVLLKTEVNDVHWILDKKQAFAMARKAGAKYVLIADVTVAGVYSTGALQPTYNVALDASLHNAATGRVVKGFSDSLTRMGATSSAAAKDAAAYLGKKLAQEMDDDQ